MCNVRALILNCVEQDRLYHKILLFCFGNSLKSKYSSCLANMAPGWEVTHVSLRQQCRGPIRNVIVSVSALYTEKIGEMESVEFTVDEKITVFFTFGLHLDIKSEIVLLPFVSFKTTKGTQNCQVEITYDKFRKTISCCEEVVKVGLNYCHGEWVGYNGDRKCYTIAVNFIVHENISMSIHTKLYEDTEFTDFKLKASDGAVAVHKSILAFQSDMFKTMLKGEWKETVEGCINMDGVTMETLQRLKDYMYLGTIPDEGLEALILLAEHYLMDKLKADCIAKLVKSVNSENLDSIIKFACQSSRPEELVSALICGIPDDVANSVYKLKNSKEIELNDEK